MKQKVLQHMVYETTNRYEGSIESGSVLGAPIGKYATHTLRSIEGLA